MTYCPTNADIFRNALPLLPRGDAWQSDEPPGQVFTANWAQSGLMQAGMFQQLTRPPSILHQFWSAVSDVYAFVAERFCDLKKEFFCATAFETLDLWFQEYGLPDSCDPFPDLCAKVAALGGTDCNYYSAVAANAGWSITCKPLFSAICAEFGLFQFGGGGFGGVGGVATIQVLVDLDSSPAFTGLLQTQPFFGAFQFGNTLNCAPDISALQCLLDRIIHAHIAVIYQTV
jgi:uncharacterized protein YmfQ (DUF2313 family)